MGKAKIGLRSAAVVSVAALALAACGGGSGGGSTDKAGAGGGAASATKGGTLTFLTLADQIQHLDPQRSYTGEDLAFAGGYLQRTLTSFKFSTNGEEANSLTPDLATDTGKATDGAKTWAFTLKDGVKFEDGSPITCADVKYGVSRTFAIDVITDGPQYAVSMLDIPKAKDGSSVYKGPYTTKGNDTAAYDKAVECSSDNKTITFHLSKPVGDFNYTVTLLSFSPVPKAADTGEKYDDKPVSSGPYKITEYTKGSQLVLDRNPNWDAKTDNYRGAYPDKIVMKFGLEASVIDQRMIANAGEDQAALSPDPVEPASLQTVFGSDEFKDRRVNELDPYVRYIVVNTKKVPDLNQRKAIAAALDRKQLQTIAGGTYSGDLADGVVKPNLPTDYEKTGMFDGGLLGANIPPNGDPAVAKKFIADSGKPMPTLQYDYPQTPTNDKGAAAVVSSLGKAGIKVKPNPIESGQFYGIVFDPAKEGHLVLAGWGPDWPNASTVVPELFTPSGGFNLSQANDKAFNAKVDQAKAQTDRNAQATLWKELNKEAMANVWVVPTRFGREQRLAGSKVKSASGKNGQVYIWSPYGSWSYGDLYVTK